MRKRTRKILISILIIGGLALLLYPNVQRIQSELHQTVAISRYEDGQLHYDEKMKQEEFQRAAIYNQRVAGKAVSDPFSSSPDSDPSDDYEEILNIDMGMMGTLEIPCINVNLPIYHGISQSVLRKGVGHLQQTAFPVGGEGNHTVLSAHRGLPEARLFSDLDKVEIGDEFYIHIFDEVLAYKVDQIKVVEPEKTEYLMPIAGEDHVTLLTCTPYGINSHRLLVRGVRTEYTPEVKEQIETRVVHTEWYAVFGIAGAVLVFIIIGICRKLRRRKR